MLLCAMVESRFAKLLMWLNHIVLMAQKVNLARSFVTDLLCKQLQQSHTSKHIWLQAPQGGAPVMEAACMAVPQLPDCGGGGAYHHSGPAQHGPFHRGG